MVDLITTLKIFKSYFFHWDLTRRLDREKIKKYQDNALKRVIKYAFATPFYRKKYEELGLKLSDINGLEDIYKLPVITREDFMDASPDDLLPKGINRRDIFQVSTSGSTGQPLFIWNDSYTALRCLQGFAEELFEHGINWRKHKIAIIGDFSPIAPENAYLQKIFLSKFLNNNNFQILDIKEDAFSLLQKIGRFKPDFIGGYPPLLLGLASLKKRGFGAEIKPICIATSGTLLDKKARDFIKENFNAKLFDSYSSTEGGAMAFQCKEGNYHVHSELVYIEILGKDNEPVEYGEKGKIVVTRLYGRATPVIRYAGMKDSAKRVGEGCKCGRETPIISEIKGRRCDPLVTSDKRIVSPFYFTSVICKYVRKGLKINGFQIMQNSLDEVTLLFATKDDDFDYKLIERDFKSKLGESVKINIKHVKKLESNAPLVSSKLIYEGLE